MKDLIFDTGLVTYNINGKCEFSFNPTDSAFVEKLFNAFDILDKKQDAYKAEVEKTANKREVFETARKMDEEMREIINDVFGFDICPVWRDERIRAGGRPAGVGKPDACHHG